MSRNSSGTYTLPAGNPVVYGDIIDPSWANNTLGDIASALTDSLSRSGEGAMTAPLRVVDGTVSAPGVAFTSETGSGAYRAAAGDWYLTVLGSGIARMRSAGVDVTGALGVSGGATFGGAVAVNGDTLSLTSSTAYYPQFSSKNKTNDANSSYHLFDKDRAGAIVQSGDNLGNLVFRGYDGSSYVQAASIIGYCNGTPGTNDMPGALAFLTTADGTSAPVERMRINQAGNIGVGTSDPGYKLHVKRDDASASNWITSQNATATGAVGSGFLAVAGSSGYYSFFAQTADKTLSISNSTDTGPIVFSAGTGAERARITSTGNVGIGTSSPNFNGATGTVCHINNSTANAWAVSHYTNGSTGSSAGDGLLVGSLGSDAYIFNYETSSLIFGTSNAEKMRIDSSGNVGIGTTSSIVRLYVQSSGATNATYIFGARNSSQDCFLVRSDGAVNTGLAALSPYNLTTGSVANCVLGSDGFMYRSTSSAKYKNSIEDANHGLKELLQLRPVTYKGTNDGDKVFGGLIAEEVHGVGLTEFVEYAPDGSPDALAYSNMVSLCIKAIQELNAKIESQQAEIEALKSLAK